MGLIKQNKQITSTITTNEYVKLDSVRYGLEVEDNKILCLCREWLDTVSRENDELCYRNVNYLIPSEPIEAGESIIASVYKLLKKFFEEQGETVSNDDETYETNIQAKKEEENKAMMEAMVKEEEEQAKMNEQEEMVVDEQKES